MTFELPGLSRRQLLGALGLGGAWFLAAGCQSAVNQASTTGQGSTEPQAGGTLRAGIIDDLIPGNIFTNSTAGITTVVGLVYEGLIRYPNDEVTPRPRLATSWELASDGRSLALELRDDVKFHTGRPFTSKDVEFSLQTYADPRWNGQMQSTAAAITSVDTTEPHRAVLRFEHRLGNIFDLLDTVPIIDRETVDAIGTGERFVGTGPFVLESWTPNSELVFTKNSQYYVPERPYLDGVQVNVMPDASSLVSALRSAQIDFANGLNYRDIEVLMELGGFEPITLTGAEQQIYVGANVTAKPLRDIRVRQAIAYALDRERIMSEVYRDSGYVANLPWPKYSSAFDEQKNQTYGLDLAKAKRLLDGVSEPIPALPLTYRTGSPLLDATVLIVESNLRAAGIPVELDPIDNAQFTKQLIGAEFDGLWAANHSWAQYTPSTLTVSAYPFNAHGNASLFESRDYAADADRSWQIADGTSAAAVAAYEQVSDDLLKYLFLVEIGVIEPRWVMSDRLRDVSYTKRAEVDLVDAFLA